MSRLMKRLAAVLTIVGVLALAGCTSKTPETKPAETKPAQPGAPAGPTKGGTLVIGQSADVLTLDPALTTDEASRPVQSLLFNSLVKYNDKMEILADVAESYEVKDAEQRAAGARLACLGRTRNGAPRHPLYVRADQPLERFP